MLTSITQIINNCSSSRMTFVVKFIELTQKFVDSVSFVEETKFNLKIWVF